MKASAQTVLPLQLLRHQAGAVLATAVDFGVMALLVSGVGLSPVLGTVAGATCGAVSNFTLGRRWIFRAQGGAPSAQALRYLLVSACSLGLNAGGEWLLAVRLGLGYLLARAIVAASVSLLWNYPMQRHFVFAAERTP